MKENLRATEGRGEEANTKRENIGDMIYVSLTPLRDFLQMVPVMDEENMDKVSCIAAALLENAEHNIHKGTNMGELRR
jgi:hypothetical protein